ncbi:patatin-like phospholipase family protein [Bryocella elongata]|nr:patatin-like phospholipase family protein [Bryocella elongata]
MTSASSLVRRSNLRTLIPAIVTAIAIQGASCQAPAITLGSNTPTPSTAVRPRIGLALEGGGALGIAHVGVLLWLEEHRIPVDEVAGTSMGALIGSLYASGRSAAEIEHLSTDTNFDTLFTLQPSLSELSFRRRMEKTELPQAITIGLRHGTPSLGSALIADDQLNAFLSREMDGYNSENLDFDKLPIPFRCVATNLTTLRPAVFRTGSLPFAVRASISIPGVFPPVRHGDDILVDGAILDNLPIDVLRDEQHAEVVISVYLGDSPFPEQDASSAVGIFERALSAGTSRNVELNRPHADIEIAPQVQAYSVVDYRKAKALIHAGYAATESQRAKLLPLALSEADWAEYQAAARSRKRTPPSLIRTTAVSGPDAATSKQVQVLANTLNNHPFSAPRAEGVVATLRGDGALSAYYETFSSASTQAGTAVSSTVPDDGVKIFWHPRAEGPPYLLLGTEVVASTSNVTSTIFDIRFVDQNFGGYGSELLADVRLGYRTQANAEFYHPLGGTRFFIQPDVQLRREPVYLWQDQRRISERFLQHAGGGFDAGFAFSRNLQTAIEYRASTIRWTLVDGADSSPTPQLSGREESLAAHVIFSTRTAAIASPHGTSVDLQVGHLFDTSASKDAPFVELKARQSFTFANVNLISISTEVDSYFRNQVADPLRFTLGGPLRLYASSIDEYRGTDVELVRAIYSRRVASLPTGIGQGIYVTGGYEQGNIWSPEHPAIFVQDGFGGLLFSTPLGAITLGGAVGDDDHRKLFFTFGKLF